MKPKHIFIIFIGFFSIVTFSCKKFLDVGAPKTSLVTENVFSDNLTATTALLGLYAQITKNVNVYNGNLSLYLGTSADELKSYSSSNKYYTNSLSPNDLQSPEWTESYTRIYEANSVIEGLQSSTNISTVIKQQLKGEALFLRAFFHFYLVNLFGDIPYITTTDYRVNNLASRMPVAEVYTHIITDLKEAQSMVNEKYLDNRNEVSSERVRINKTVVDAMLARVYLYTKNWTAAETEATSVINNSDYSLLQDLNSVFLMNSKEAILQLQPISPSYSNGGDGYNFILTTAPTNVALTDQLWAAFEDGDKRKLNWTGSFTNGTTTWHFAYKFKVKKLSMPTVEYPMVLRLAEQYLIRAEARTQLGNMEDAVKDINAIRARARATDTDLPDIKSTIGKADCLIAIEKERRIELFTEWGHRWLDLKRTDRANEILAPIKGSNWQSTDQLFPIPNTQLDKDPNMTGHQNPGYN